MDDRLVDLEKNEFLKPLEKIFFHVYSRGVYSIIDVNPGKISLSILLNSFKNARIDSYMYPWNQRKKSDLLTWVKSHRYSIIEKDVFKSDIEIKYDLLLAFNYFSEALKLKYKFSDLVDHLLTIKNKYFVILDTFDNPLLDYKYMEEMFDKNNFKLIAYEELVRENKFGLSIDDANNYCIYLFEKLKPYEIRKR